MAFVRKDSRYLETSVLKDSEGKEFFNTWKSIPLPQQDNDQIHETKREDLGRLDSLAQKYFANPNLWWTIPHSNTIEDPFTEIDWSDASDQMVYPNYAERGIDAKVQYPTDIDNVKDKKLPEYEIGSLFRIPSPDSVQNMMLEAQKKGIE